MAVLYRVRQFIRTMWGVRQAPDLADLGGLLTPGQQALFRAMAPVDQQHCLAVARALAAQGQRDADLLRAALVHDAGKSTTAIAVWERVAHVLLQHYAPLLVGRVGSARPGGPGHGLYVLARHSQVGAGLAQAAGFSPVTVALVRGDGEPVLQDALRRIDDRH